MGDRQSFDIRYNIIRNPNYHNLWRCKRLSFSKHTLRLLVSLGQNCSVRSSERVRVSFKTKTVRLRLRLRLRDCLSRTIISYHGQIVYLPMILLLTSETIKVRTLSLSLSLSRSQYDTPVMYVHTIHTCFVLVEPMITRAYHIIRRCFAM